MLDSNRLSIFLSKSTELQFRKISEFRWKFFLKKIIPNLENFFDLEKIFLKPFCMSQSLAMIVLSNLLLCFDE